MKILTNYAGGSVINTKSIVKRMFVYPPLYTHTHYRSPFKNIITILT